MTQVELVFLQFTHLHWYLFRSLTQVVLDSSRIILSSKYLESVRVTIILSKLLYENQQPLHLILTEAAWRILLKHESVMSLLSWVTINVLGLEGFVGSCPSSFLLPYLLLFSENLFIACFLCIIVKLTLTNLCCYLLKQLVCGSSPECILLSAWMNTGWCKAGICYAFWCHELWYQELISVPLLPRQRLLLLSSPNSFGKLRYACLSCNVLPFIQ